MTSPKLVLTADDFGADRAVNAAVEQAHRHGVLTAASLMVGAAATAEAVARAKDLPSLRVGLHLVLTDGQPILGPDRTPHLVGSDGRFRSDMLAAGFNLYFNPLARRELKVEIEAQFTAFAATGLRLDHVNAHKHFHLHPTILGLILDVGFLPRHEGDTRALRASGRAGRGGAQRQAATPTAGRVQAARARARARRAGLLVPDQVFGLAWSGAMTSSRLVGLLSALPPGLTEIYLHPATRDDFEGAEAGYRYADEFAALVSPDVAMALNERGALRGGFADFQP